MKNLVVITISLLFFCIVSEAKNCKTHNPYSPGTGHYAGFEWADRKNVSSCGGKSTSFIKGCEEYLAQKAKCD